MIILKVSSPFHHTPIVKYRIILPAWMFLRIRCVVDSLDYLEKELEALLWICFSSRYILFIFEEKNVFRLFFIEKIFDEKISHRDF